jgi:hypothetical protein
MPQPAPPPEPAPQEVRRPGRHISLAYLDDEFGEDLPPPKLQDITYLDALLGQKAPGAELEPPRLPAWRLRRRFVPVQRVRDLPPEAPDAAVPMPREPRPAQPSDTSSLVVSGAICLALVVLGIAVLIHLFAPNAVPGYSVAEFDLKVQMRAVEWLLAGILIALVGLLLKR